MEKNIKKEVWNALYPECKDDFIERIKSYKPAIILNACTKDKPRGSDTLKDQVKKTIDQAFSGSTNSPQKFSVSHPASWNTLVEEW